jgi:hypothetical protein
MNMGSDFIPQRSFTLNTLRPNKSTVKSNKYCNIYLGNYLSYSLHVQVCISKSKIIGAILRTRARQNMCEELFIPESGDASKIYTIQFCMKFCLLMQI